MRLTLAGILYLFGSVLVFYFVDRLSKSFKKTQNQLTFYFKNIALYGGICTLIYGLMCIFFPDNSFILGIGNIIGEGFLLIGYVYGLAFFFYLTFPEIPQKKIFLIGGVLIFISTVSRIIFFPYPTVTESGILRFNTPPIPALTYIVWAVVGAMPLAGAFILEGIKKPEIRVRSLLLGFILLAIGVTSAIHASVENILIYTLAFLAQMTSFLLLFIVILSSSKEPQDKQF